MRVSRRSHIQARTRDADAAISSNGQEKLAASLWRAMRSIATAFCLALLAGCSRGQDAYVIGAAGPWKEGYGVMTRRGIDLAVEEINNGGGIKGTPLKVLARDDEAS